MVATGSADPFQEIQFQWDDTVSVQDPSSSSYRFNRISRNSVRSMATTSADPFQETQIQRDDTIEMGGLLIGVFCLFALIGYVSLKFSDYLSRQTFVGYISVASLISMFATPLLIGDLVIKRKSVESMPFYLSLATFLISVTLFAYGMFIHDFFIYIPSGIGTILGVVQLLLYVYYSRRSEDEYRLPLLA